MRRGGDILRRVQDEGEARRQAHEDIREDEDMQLANDDDDQVRQSLVLLLLLFFCL